MTQKKAVSAPVVLLVTTVGSFMSTFAGSSVNVALPPLGAALGMGGVALNWVTTAFVLGSAIFLLPMGRLGDIIGRKKVFAAGMALYALGSLLTFLAPSGLWLIAMRALTGIGASMLGGTATAILVGSYPPQERGRVLGINVAAVYLGMSVGPFLGGIITMAWGWRSLFLVHAILATLEFGLIVSLLRQEWHAAQGEKFDFPGTLFYALGLGALLIGFSGLPNLGSILLLAAGLAGLVLFVLWELRSHHPLLQVRIFKGNRVFALSNLAAMISYSATFSVGFFLSLYLQVVRGFSPQLAGLIMVAQPVMQALFSPLSGKLSDRIEPRLLSSVGMLLTAISLALLSFLGPDSSVAVVLADLMLLGLGFALFSSPNTNAVMGAVEHKHLGIASATISTMRSVGMAASMGIALLLFAFFLGSQAVSPDSAPAFLQALQAAFGIAAVLCFLGIFASLSRGKVTRV